MDKLKMQSLDITKCNIEKIGALFPNVLTETKDENGKLIKAINFDKLRQELTDDIIDGSEESYDFTWVGKTQAIIDANTPIRKTLRPVVEDETTPTGADSNGNPYISTGSKNFDTTENLYIEGDNFEVLRLLQESYLNSIKMIYIDPPYNTGNDSFVYPDNFAMDKDEYEDEIAYRDEDGNIQFKQNNEANPKFHSDWCSMIYQRLKLAKNLLTDDGVIFISIDDNEVENLKKICNEIFGEQNFEGHIHWRRRHNQPNDKTKMIGIVTEHIIVFAKNSNYLKLAGVGKLDLTSTFSNPDNDPKGAWSSKPWKVGSDQSGSIYSIITPTGKILNGAWMGEESTYNSYLAEGRMYFPKGGDGMPRKKYYQFEREEEGQCATNWWTHEIFGHNQGANDCMTDLMGLKNIFSNPKPIELLRSIIKISNVKKHDTILDFFSGSATTAHAVMQLNAEDDGNRKFIMVQLPEVTDEKSEAKKANYDYITEIGKERIRRAGEKIKEQVEQDNSQLKLGKEPKKVPDIGFRVLKCDSTNMKDVYYGANAYSQATLDDMISNIKEDRNALDLLYGVLLDWGIQLSSNCEALTIDEITVYNYDDGSLIACLDDKKVSETAIREIAKMQPLRVVFRDSSFANSPDKINVEEIFKLNAPNTSVRVI